MNFNRRSHQAEMMDAEKISFEDFQNCLHGLEIVNSCVLAYRPTLHWLTKTLRAINPRQPISILDVGSGGGGMLRKIRKRARRYGREIRLTERAIFKLVAELLFETPIVEYVKKMTERGLLNL